MRNSYLNMQLSISIEEENIDKLRDLLQAHCKVNSLRISGNKNTSSAVRRRKKLFYFIQSKVTCTTGDARAFYAKERYGCSEKQVKRDLNALYLAGAITKTVQSPSQGFQGSTTLWTFQREVEIL